MSKVCGDAELAMSCMQYFLWFFTIIVLRVCSVILLEFEQRGDQSDVLVLSKGLDSGDPEHGKSWCKINNLKHEHFTGDFFLLYY